MDYSQIVFPAFCFFRHFFIQRCTISKKPDLAAESKATNCRVNDTMNVVFREVFALSTQARHIFIKKANPIFNQINTRFSPLSLDTHAFLYYNYTVSDTKIRPRSGADWKVRLIHPRPPAAGEALPCRRRFVGTVLFIIWRISWKPEWPWWA